MYPDKTERYNQCSKLIAEYGQTFRGIEFDEKEQALEVYYLMTIKLLERHTKAIPLLINNNCFVEIFPLVRNLMETYFKINWVVDTKNKQERIDRVFRLEGHAFGEYEKELQIIERHLDKKYTFYTKEAFNKLVDHIEREKKTQLQLTDKDENGKIKYKSSPPLANMMGEIFRVKYYHLYRFVCTYIHPSPFLKTFLLNYNLYEKNPNELLNKPLNQALGIGLKFMSLTVGYSIDIFNKYNLESHKKRIRLYYEIDNIAKEGYEGYII